jgi:hypothetical protein
LVYPELANGVKGPAKREAPSDSQGMLSQKLDAMLKDAKIDGINCRLETVSKILNQRQKYCSTAESMASTQKYSEDNGCANGISKQFI